MFCGKDESHADTPWDCHSHPHWGGLGVQKELLFLTHELPHLEVVGDHVCHFPGLSGGVFGSRTKDAGPNGSSSQKVPEERGRFLRNRNSSRFVGGHRRVRVSPMLNGMWSHRLTMLGWKKRRCSITGEIRHLTLCPEDGTRMGLRCDTFRGYTLNLYYCQPSPQDLLL